MVFLQCDVDVASLPIKRWDMVLPPWIWMGLWYGGKKKKEVPLYDFQNRTMKVDTTSSWDFRDAHSWNTTTMLWGNTITTRSHHVQVSLPIATAEVPAPPDSLKRIQIIPAFKLPWALGSFQESIQTSWNKNNLSLLSFTNSWSTESWMKCNCSFMPLSLGGFIM